MDEYIPQYNYLIVKLDLRNYKNISKYLTKPYDDNMVKVLGLVSSSLMSRFLPDTIFIGHYQIALFFSSKCSIDEFEQLYKSPTKKIESHIYNGSTNMILSLISSYCSVKFNYYLDKIYGSEKNKEKYSVELFEIIERCEQIFVGTINYSHEVSEIIEYFNNECVRNSYSNNFSEISNYYLGQENIANKADNDIYQMLNFIGIDLYSTYVHILYGFYLKKNNFNYFQYKKSCKQPNLINQIFLKNWFENEDFEDFEDIQELI